MFAPLIFSLLPVTRFMRTLLNGSRRKIFRLPGTLVLLFLASTGYGQTAYTLRGTVTDAFNEAVPGATVQLQGTTTGTVTDISGNYALQATVAPGNYTLVFRSLGLLTREIPVTLGADTELTNDVALSDDLLSLDEVVVTGTSVQTSKKQLGNAISTVSSEDIAQFERGGRHLGPHRQGGRGAHPAKLRQPGRGRERTLARSEYPGRKL